MGKVIMRLLMCGHACSIIHSCPTFVDYSLPDFSVHVNFPARILEWVATSFSRDLPNPGIEPVSLSSPAMTGRLFTTSTPLEACWCSYTDIKHSKLENRNIITRNKLGHFIMKKSINSY